MEPEVRFTGEGRLGCEETAEYNCPYCGMTACDRHLAKLDPRALCEWENKGGWRHCPQHGKYLLKCNR